MSISDNYEPTKDLANGTTIIFTADWDPLSTNYGEVYSEDYETGEQTEITTGITKERTTDNKFKVTFSTAPGDSVAEDSVYIILSRNIPETNEENFKTSAGFPSALMTFLFDKVVGMVQELKESAARSLTYPLGTDSGITQTIPAPDSSNVGKTIKVNDTGDGWEITGSDPDDAQEDSAANAAAALASANAASSSSSSAEGFKNDAEGFKDEAETAAAKVPDIATGDADKVLSVKTDESGNEYKYKVVADLTSATDLEIATAKAVSDVIAALDTSVPYIKVSDTKTSGTDGGTFTSGDWRTRDINTEDNDDGGHCSIGSNQITLAAGTYEVDILAPAKNVNSHQLRLYNVDNSSTELLGTSARCYSTSNNQNYSFIKGKITLSSETIFEIQHRCSADRSTDGLGENTSFGEGEVYTVAIFRKVG